MADNSYDRYNMEKGQQRQQRQGSSSSQGRDANWDRSEFGSGEQGISRSYSDRDFSEGSRGGGAVRGAMGDDYSADRNAQYSGRSRDYSSSNMNRDEDYGYEGSSGRRFGSSSSGSNQDFGSSSNQGYGSSTYGGDRGFSGQRSERGQGRQSGGERGGSMGSNYEDFGMQSGRSDFNTSGSSYDRYSSTEGSKFRGKGPKGYSRSEDRIKEDVCEALAQSSEVDASEIEVSVKEGDVTLTGTVNERQMKRMAEDIAERVSGVKDVTNQIRVQRSEERSSESGLSASQSSTKGSSSSSRADSGSSSSSKRSSSSTQM